MASRKPVAPQTTDPANTSAPAAGELADVSATNDAAGQNAEPVVTHLLVRSLAPGFRRGGRAWPAEEIEVSVDDFSAEQLDQIMAEPMLNVMPVAE